MHILTLDELLALGLQARFEPHVDGIICRIDAHAEVGEGVGHAATWTRALQLAYADYLETRSNIIRSRVK